MKRKRPKGKKNWPRAHGRFPACFLARLEPSAQPVRATFAQPISLAENLMQEWCEQYFASQKQQAPEAGNNPVFSLSLPCFSHAQPHPPPALQWCISPARACDWSCAAPSRAPAVRPFRGVLMHGGGSPRPATEAADADGSCPHARAAGSP